ncbi:hypothetical protein QJS10_CPA06g01816 [Acorus calamus]|uniref:Uncharacterized protein n=1 Tax=Acorus calamus TaxID=4465 RepID=A0AAV9EJN2_ACOCL|nr:hypothetical protein QJS10_CPA06g01816 [Acorus calamus]
MASSTTVVSKKRKANHMEGDEEVSDSPATPRAERFRIPEVRSCPPAPKRRRRFALRAGFESRRSITFFAPPEDLELFFCLALHNVS